MQTILIFGGPDPLVALNYYLQARRLVTNWSFQESGANDASVITAYLSSTLS